MSLTVADWLPGIRPHLAEGLLAAEGFERVARIAPHLPGTCLTSLEILLPQTGEPQGADLSVRIQRPAEARAMAKRVPEPRIQTFLVDWSERTSLRRQAPEVWLEFDLLAHREPVKETLPAPVVCARLAAEADRGWVVDELLPALHGDRALPELQRRATLVALEALPTRARLLYVFSLRSRCPDLTVEPAPIRLEISGLRAEAFVPYLARVATPATATARAAQVRDLLPLVQAVDRNHLSFDLAPDLQPRIGVELSFRGLPGREPGWSSLFDRLQGLSGTGGVAAKGIQRAVWAWPGWSSFWTDPETWPAAAGAAYCVRSLSHFKVVTRPERPPQAKVYLLFGPWRRRPS